MSPIVVIVTIFAALVLVLGGVAYVAYSRTLRRAKAIERGLKMVPILIHLPPPSDDTATGGRDLREVLKEKVSQAETLYALIAGTAQEGFKSHFYGQRHIGMELVASGGLIHFYAAVPVALVSVVEKAILTAYPGAHVEEAEDHNIFNKEGRLASTMGGELVLKHDYAYPIATYQQLDRDPLEAIINALSSLVPGEGAAVQIMLRPASASWTKHAIGMAKKKQGGGSADMTITPLDVMKAAVKAPSSSEPTKAPELSGLETSAVGAIEEKTKHPGYEVLIRLVVSTANVTKSQSVLHDLTTAFALFDAPGMNGFKFLPQPDPQGLVTAFIFRFFPPEINGMILATPELATLFHLPDAQFTPSMKVERQMTKQVDGPSTISQTGLLMGYNEFRGTKKEIHLSPEDRRRHTYIVGQTGTGKSTMLENLIVQDMLAGNGFAFIDPHGDSAEKLLGLVPKERAEDVIYFNPADTEYPLGLNLFEFSDPAQKDFIIQETIGMLYKLYDPGHTGIIGPRYEHWYRNAALTLMSDPNGSTFIEVPKVFTDTEYLKRKFKYLQDPTVIDFWTKEMGQTSDYHKSEMLGWFVSKFGAFTNNEMMRNIIGQTKSAFDLRDIMDNKKILIVNLSKGRLGELNAQLLGMIFVIKFQAAAMSRADMPEADRVDFSLYVDEFQNFSTDSFASILSEARKYRLNLIVANQFIGQLSTEIRDAVFGNVGTIVAHRSGPEDAEFLVKQFAPTFDVLDLVNIPNFHSVLRLMIGGLPSQPFSMSDLPPVANVSPELGLAIKQLSAAKFGLGKADVERDILGRLQGATAAAEPAATTIPEPAAAPALIPAPPVAPAPEAPVPAAVTSDQPTAAPVTPAMPDAAPRAEASIADIVGPPKAAVADDSTAAAEPATMPPVAPPIAAEAQAEIDQLLSDESTIHQEERHRLSEVAPELTAVADQTSPELTPTAEPLSNPVEAASPAPHEAKVIEPPVAPPEPTLVPVPAAQPVVETPVVAPPAPQPAPIPEPAPLPSSPEPAMIMPTAPIARPEDHEARHSDREAAATTTVTMSIPQPTPSMPLSTPAPMSPAAEVQAALAAMPQPAPSQPAPAPSVSSAPVIDAAAIMAAGGTIGPTPPPPATTTTHPALAPGEVYIDDNGNVVQG